jgi:hypothetical protein
MYKYKLYQTPPMSDFKKQHDELDRIYRSLISKEERGDSALWDPNLTKKYYTAQIEKEKILTDSNTLRDQIEDLYNKELIDIKNYTPLIDDIDDLINEIKNDENYKIYKSKKSH